jgi:peptidoglycan/LPS O-acetylase OafA/YrhL
MGLVRFLLACAVILVHCKAGMCMTGGSVSVQTFFMISGFYMALVLNEKYLQGESSYWRFLASRFLRIFPAYWVILVLTIGARAVTPGGDWRLYHDALTPWTSLVLGFTNVFLFGQDVVFFLGFEPERGTLHWVSSLAAADFQAQRFMLVPQAWSLALELVFYTLAPFLVRKPTRIVFLILLSLGLRLVLVFGLQLRVDPWEYRFFPNELALFLTGSLGYHAYRQMKHGGHRTRTLGTVAWIVMVVSILGFDRVEFPGKTILYFVLIAVCIPAAFLRTKALKVDRFIGELSYPIYISHILVISVLRRAGFDSLAMILFVTVLVSLALMLLLEQPIDRVRQRLASRQPAMGGAARGEAA